MFYGIGIIVLALIVMLFFMRRNYRIIDHSIMPQFEHFQKGNVPINKLTKTQLDQINELLSHKDEKVRIVSYNMLFNICEETLEKKHRWKKRRRRVAQLMKAICPDIIGSQELFQGQVDDLLALIDDSYAFYGRDSHDGLDEGMVNGIFYRRDRLDLIEGRVFYISSTPDILSYDPYDQMQFITVCKFRDKKTKKSVFVMNTHLSFYSADAREYAAHFIVDLIATRYPDEPVVLTGDFNTFPFRPDIERLPYYDGDFIHSIITQGVMRDARDVSTFGHIGPLSTFTSDNRDTMVHPFCGTGTPGVILDHIYVNEMVKVIAHAIEPARVGKQFPSDHMPVVADIYLQS